MKAFGLSRTSLSRPFRIGLLMSLALVPAVAEAECGSDALSVEGSRDEIEETCRAINDVARYFRDIGFSFSPRVTIKFSQQVLLKFYSSDNSGTPIDVQVSGFYDPVRTLVEVTSPTSQSMKDRKPWGVPWSQDMAYSILRHEIAHVAIHQSFGGQSKSVSKAWMEFIAYAIQIHLLDDKVRAAVLENYKNATPFEAPERVNQFIYGYDPDAFGVRAYLYVREKGGPEFIRKVIAGESGLDLHEIFWTK